MPRAESSGIFARGGKRESPCLRQRRGARRTQLTDSGGGESQAEIVTANHADHKRGNDLFGGSRLARLLRFALAIPGSNASRSAVKGGLGLAGAPTPRRPRRRQPWRWRRALGRRSDG